MSNYKIDASKLKQIPIENLLDKLGYKPKTTKPNELWYISPFRDENTPSFKVSTNLNLWHDFADGQGGDIIRLVEKLYNLTFKEAIEELARLTGYTANKEYKPKPIQQKQGVTQNQTKEKVEIRKLQDLQNEALIEYLKSRKVNIDIAKHYLQEIYYTNDNKNYFALAFKNDSGGYEIRSKYFQGSLKGYPKDITTLKSQSHNSNQNTLLIFEGFIYFLSFFTVQNIKSIQDLKYDVIVLNSLSFIPKLINEILPNNPRYKELHCYLDTDDAGRKAINTLLLELDDIKVIDKSNLYAKSGGDLNDLATQN